MVIPSTNQQCTKLFKKSVSQTGFQFCVIVKTCTIITLTTNSTIRKRERGREGERKEERKKDKGRKEGFKAISILKKTMR